MFYEAACVCIKGDDTSSLLLHMDLRHAEKVDLLSWISNFSHTEERQKSFSPT
jgi:hypothetical protein